MKIGKYISVVILTFVALGFGSARAQDNLAREAYSIFQQNCLSCHGPGGPHKDKLLIESAEDLIATGTVVPGNPDASEFYKRLLGPTENGAQMPLNEEPLPEKRIDTIRRWILNGAPNWVLQRDVNFITTDATLTAIQNHLRTLDPFDQPYARYFTMTHLYNAGEIPEDLHTYQIGLSKLVNSLSWVKDITNPQPIDTDGTTRGTIFYIDLRDYEWEADFRNAWPKIEAEYPYTIEYDPETQADLLTKLTSLRQDMDCEVPFVHVDWFLATASLPLLYHDILELPMTDIELERALGIDVARNMRSPGRSVWRAGMKESGVSKHNRVVERHRSRYGAYWKSYDFAGSKGTKDISTHPLSFEKDGGEVIFNLPNGLQAYYITDGSGNRIDVAPTDIVSIPSPADGDPSVRNGLSCIGCHTEGMKTFEDVVRASIENTENPPFDKEFALRLYVKKAEMDALVAKDIEDYKAALALTGGSFDDINEPVSGAHAAFQGELDAAHAAAAVGLETEVFRKEIEDKPSLQNLGLVGLLSEDVVKRDVWTANFSDVISALYSEDPVPPGPEPRPPHPGFTIPDANLRAAVEAALGKTPGALITAAEMARLEVIEADDAGISNLTGLEAATELRRIEFRHNSISDLSPLRGLTRLNNIKLRGNRITDVSPLAELINVDWLGLEENEITDLSPLKGLTKLNGIGIANNPILDISPLSGMKSLEGIEARNTFIADFSPLAELPRFRWIELGHDKRIDALPSLKGLKSLRRLVINHTGISDISGLAALTQLQSLTLHDNSISDVSPLANLKNLTHLNLDGNVISAISSLEKLKNLKELYLQNNVISDVSPLAGLTNLEQLNLNNNAISDFSPLKGLTEKVFIRSIGNPGLLLQGGRKIKGPWLWVQFPGLESDDFRNKDLLAGASGGDVTELEIATNGATEGQSLGDKAWTSGTLKSDSWNNIREMLGGRDDVSNIIYGSIALDSPREQKTKMFAGSGDHHKVWLNGQLINEHYGWSDDYQVFFPVTLKQGKNVLLISVYKWDGHLGGHFGFAPDTEYTVIPPGSRFSFSTAATQVKVGGTFTVQLKAENISDLAGWQTDIKFDPAVLKVNVNNVSEGNFLKQGGGRTHFLRGTIDNTEGRIIGVGSARISEGGASGEGALLSVTFTAKANGETRLSLREFQAGSSGGETIASRPPDMIITVGDPSPLDISDGPFSLSTDVTPVRLGGTFNLLLKAEDVTDLAGWQTDISFDSALLEAVAVNQGDFLNVKIGDTFFLQGAIDNTAGKITGISTAKLKGSGNGTGTLLLVTFKAKAVGETRVALSGFFAGSSGGETISSGVPEIRITIEDRAFPAWDVNQDGQVNVLDLILVAQYLGEDASVNPRADVNGDGTINVLDLIVVAQNLGESTAAAPSGVAAIDSLELDPAMVQAWIAAAAVKNDGSIAFRQGIENLERLLGSLLPEKTALLANYPNPFNPETWIPYDLAAAADVTVHIYAADGALIRTLALGHQAAGIYQSRSRAVYWDGRNNVGEPVASGVYFYTLTAGDFTATRKMLIRK